MKTNIAECFTLGKSETLKNTYEEAPFLAKLRLKAYNFTKNGLL